MIDRERRSWGVSVNSNWKSKHFNFQRKQEQTDEMFERPTSKEKMYNVIY